MIHGFEYNVKTKEVLQSETKNDAEHTYEYGILQSRVQTYAMIMSKIGRHMDGSKSTEAVAHKPLKFSLVISWSLT